MAAEPAADRSIHGPLQRGAGELRAVFLGHASPEVYRNGLEPMNLSRAQVRPHEMSEKKLRIKVIMSTPEQASAVIAGGDYTADVPISCEEPDWTRLI